jgi:putative hemolysin
MEDILEELVGEVHDEFDITSTSLTADHFILDGMMTIAVAEDRLGELSEEVQSSTLGGYVSEQLERIPVVGDQVEFGDYTLTVEEMEGMRVSKLRYERSETPVSEDKQ